MARIYFKKDHEQKKRVRGHKKEGETMRNGDAQILIMF